MPHKLRLKDDTFAPASIFGVVSDLPDYRLCYIINNELSLKLCRCEKDKELYFKNQKLCYSEFMYHEAVAMRTWRLTANGNALFYKEDAGSIEMASVPLVQDLKSMNYFIWYDEESKDELNNFVLTRLRNNKYIRTVQQINSSASKNIANLLLEF